MSRNYYQILEITPPSNQEEIKKTFRRLAHVHHPDKGGDEAKFKELNEAYQTLSDEYKKGDYDRRHGFRDAVYNKEFNFTEEFTRARERARAETVDFSSFDFRNMHFDFGVNFGSTEFKFSQTATGTMQIFNLEQKIANLKFKIQSLNLELKNAERELELLKKC